MTQHPSKLSMILGTAVAVIGFVVAAKKLNHHLSGLMHHRKKDTRLDERLEDSFPASDPVAQY